MEGTVSIHSHKGSKLTRFITYRSQYRDAKSWGKGSPPSQVMSEQEIERRVAST